MLAIVGGRFLVREIGGRRAGQGAWRYGDADRVCCLRCSACCKGGENSPGICVYRSGCLFVTERGAGTEGGRERERGVREKREVCEREERERWGREREGVGEREKGRERRERERGGRERRGRERVSLWHGDLIICVACAARRVAGRGKTVRGFV